MVQGRSGLGRFGPNGAWVWAPILVPGLLLGLVSGCSSGGAGLGPGGGDLVWMRVEGLSPAGSMHAVIDRGDGPVMRSSYNAFVGGQVDPTREVDVLLVPGSPGAWDVERRVVLSGAAGEVDRRESWRIDGDGSAVIVESINRAEKVEVVFEPGLRILPAGLSSGSASEQSLRMTVHPLGDRSRVRAAGGATQTVELLGTTTVPTPMGDAPALVMRTLLDASLGPSRVRNETWTWVASAPGAWGSVGVVLAERRVERTTALGIPIRSSDETWVLASGVEVVDGVGETGGAAVGGVRRVR